MSERAALRALSERAGILPEYVDIGGSRRHTSDEARVALLAAMGIDASSEAAAARELERLEAEEARQPIEPVRVTRQSEPGAPSLRLRVPPDLSGASAEYRLVLEEESGATHEGTGRLRPRRAAEHATLRLPATPEPGYHRLRLELRAGGQELRADQQWIVSPDSCLDAAELLGGRPRFGIWTHLYTVRSRRNWGIGDLTDLRTLAEWAAEVGAAFVGINPLHALRNRNGGISPYSPLSRLFHNVLYLDVAAVPELAHSPAARALIESPGCVTELARLRRAERVEYDAVLAAKLPALEALHATFAATQRDQHTQRGRAYAAFLDERGDTLTDFGTYLALDRHFADRGPRDWRAWPAAYRDPRSAEVAAFRRAHIEEVDLHRYLQFELDRQLAAAAAVDLPIGLYGDLAIGSAANGSDTWAFPGLFSEAACVGAPPDDYALAGQDWGLPPIDPRRLRAGGYRYWTLVLRAALAHMGALRVDHVMGLFRQYWVPAGRTATEGAYIRYPGEDLLGILALESRRRGALVIGEDLGTVPHGFSDILERWGILSSRVLYFEKDRDGEFRPAHNYSRRALVSVDTHDHPPLAGFWEGRDLELRRRSGSLPDDRALATARAERQREREALLRRLRAEGISPEPRAPETHAELCAALHQFLARTPAPLLGVWLDDLTGERDPLNLPGVPLDSYPSWSRKMTRELETLPGDPGVRRALEGVAGRRAR